MSGWEFAARGTITGEALRLAAVAAASLAVLLVAEALRRSGRVGPEGARKTTHFGVGILAGAFPWIFGSPITVAVLTALSVAGLLLARRTKALPGLFGVGRESLGEVYFPIAVTLLFALARHRPVLYLISIYTLVVCDALAAVLGKSYGRHSYVVTTDRKTMEGTTAFLVATFLGVELPLLLLTDLDRGACILIAVQIALLVTSFEAISVRGIDNLVVPLGTYYLLVKMTSRTAADVGQTLLVQLAILGIMLLLAWRTRFLTFSGALAAHLVLYACYALGSPRWIFAPAAALAAFLVLDAYGHRGPDPARPAYHVAAIFHMSAVATLFLFADNTFATILTGSSRLASGHPFYALFVGAIAGALATGAYLALGTGPRAVRQRRGRRAAIALALGFGVVVPAGLLLERDSLRLVDIVISGLLCALSLLGFLYLNRSGRAHDLTSRFRLVSAATLLASAVVVPLHLAWIGVVGWRLR